MESTRQEDLADLLSKLPTTGEEDYVAKVVDVYRYAMNVHEVSERNYRAAVNVDSAIHGFSTSANL